MARATTTTTLLNAETRRTVDLKRLIRTLDAVVTDTPVTITDNGIRMRAADTKTVALIDLQLKPALFHQYRLAHDTPTRVEIDMGDLKAAVCEARKGDTVGLTVTEADQDLQVTVDDTGVTSRFTIPTDSLEDADTPTTDDLEFTGKAVIALDTFKDAINRMGDAAQLTLDADGLHIESTAEAGGRSVALRAGGDHIHAIHVDDGPVTAQYATDYLTPVTKLTNTVERVTLQVGTDFPLRLTTDRRRFNLAYTVAPRISE